MLIAGAAAIREVILFPTMRPEPGTAPRTTRAGLSSSGVPTAAIDASPPAAEPPRRPPPRRLRDEFRGLATDIRRTARCSAVLTALGGVFCLLALLPGVHHRLGLATTVGDDSAAGGRARGVGAGRA